MEGLIEFVFRPLAALLGTSSTRAVKLAVTEQAHQSSTLRLPVYNVHTVFLVRASTTEMFRIPSSLSQ